MFTVNGRKLQNNLLVSGYIRLYYKPYICHAIKYLCQKYYNTIINLKINMQRFKECDTVYKRVFINDNPQFTLLGNGFIFYIERDDAFEDEFDLRLLFASSEISAQFNQIIIYFEIYCEELDIHRIGCMEISAIAQRNRNNEYMITIPEKALNDLIANDCLNIQLYTQIIGLQYKQDKLSKYNMDQRSLTSVINFKWNIKYEVYNRIIRWKGNSTKYYSHTFGTVDNRRPSYSFCLGIIPTRSELTLECLILPKGIDSIRCNVILKHESYIRIAEGILYNRVWWEEVSIIYSLDNTFDTTTFEVVILITDIYHSKGLQWQRLEDKVVNRFDWHKYNIIDRTKPNSIIDDNTQFKAIGFRPRIITNYYSIYNEALERYKNRQKIKKKRIDMYSNRSRYLHYRRTNIKHRLFNSKIEFQQ